MTTIGEEQARIEAELRRALEDVEARIRALPTHRRISVRVILWSALRASTLVERVRRVSRKLMALVKGGRL